MDPLMTELWGAEQPEFGLSLGVPAATLSTHNQVPAKRRRAPRACLPCRARKVRCDVANRGIPCSNCFLDQSACAVVRRTRKSASEIEQIPHKAQYNQPASFGSDSLLRSIVIDPPISDQPELLYPNLQVQPRLGSEAYVSDLTPSEECDEAILSSFARVCGLDSSGESLGSTNRFNSELQISTNQPALNTGSLAIPKGFVLYSSYPFLEIILISDIETQDVQFLEQCGCFLIPTKPLVDEFVQEYFMHVHSHLPVLNEDDFWEIYTRPKEAILQKRRMSLFMFQAMLFVACSFVSVSVIRQLGFRNKRLARAAFYRRAKALFDLETEREPLFTAQGTLLLTYHVTVNNVYINAYWLSTAIHFARAVNAHRYHTLGDRISPDHKNTLKRLWWCCILRDKIMSLGLRRSPQIRLADLDMISAPLTLADFEQEINKSLLHPSSTKRLLVQSIESLCRLAIILAEVVEILYPAGGITGLMEPRHLEKCALELDEWFEITRNEQQYSSRIARIHDTVVLFEKLNNIYYYSAKAALCNHAILSSVAEKNEIAPHLPERSQLRCELGKTLNGITECLIDASQLGLVQYMPISMVAYAMLPLVWHVMDHELAIRDGRRQPSQLLKLYTDAMDAFQTRYEGVDRVLDHIKKLIEMQRQTDHPISSAGNAIRLSAVHRRSDDFPTNQIITWADAIVFQPRSYLRINMIVDIALCRGDFMQDFDLPCAPLALQPAVNGTISERVGRIYPCGPMQGAASASSQNHDEEAPSFHSESGINRFDNYRVDNPNSMPSRSNLEEHATDLYTVSSPTLTTWTFYGSPGT